MRTNRKVLLAGLLTLFASFLAIMACQPNQPSLAMGVVSHSSGLADVIDGFKAGMSDFGYVEGDNVVYVYAGPTDYESLGWGPLDVVEASLLCSNVLIRDGETSK